MLTGNIEYIQRVSTEDLYFRPYWYILFVDPFIY